MPPMYFNYCHLSHRRLWWLQNSGIFCPGLNRTWYDFRMWWYVWLWTQLSIRLLNNQPLHQNRLPEFRICQISLPQTQDDWWPFQLWPAFDVKTGMAASTICTEFFISSLGALDIQAIQANYFTVISLYVVTVSIRPRVKKRYSHSCAS